MSKVQTSNIQTNCDLFYLFCLLFINIFYLLLPYVVYSYSSIGYSSIFVSVIKLKQYFVFNFNVNHIVQYRKKLVSSLTPSNGKI